MPRKREPMNMQAALVLSAASNLIFVQIGGFCITPRNSVLGFN